MAPMPPGGATRSKGAPTGRTGPTSGQFSRWGLPDRRRHLDGGVPVRPALSQQPAGGRCPPSHTLSRRSASALHAVPSARSTGCGSLGCASGREYEKYGLAILACPCGPAAREPSIHAPAVLLEERQCHDQQYRPRHYVPVEGEERLREPHARHGAQATTAPQNVSAGPPEGQGSAGALRQAMISVRGCWLCCSRRVRLTSSSSAVGCR